MYLICPESRLSAAIRVFNYPRSQTLSPMLKSPPRARLADLCFYPYSSRMHKPPTFSYSEHNWMLLGIPVSIIFLFVLDMVGL